MEFNSGGFTPPENNNYNNGSYQYSPYSMPKFVPHDVWFREKKRLKTLSTMAACAVLLYIVCSSVYSGIFLLIDDIISAVGGQAYTNFNDAVCTIEFEFIYEIIYSIFVVGGPFFLLGLIFHKKGIVGRIPMDKPQKAKYLPLVVVAGFGMCMLANVVNAYFEMFFEMLTGKELEYSIATETPTSAPGIILFYISTAVVPALIEEMALRGIIMQPLRRYGDWFAIICSALIFGFMHCNLIQIPFAFLAGIIIGYAVVVTESVWTGVLIHFMNNAFSVTVNIIYDIYGMDSWQYKICDSVFYIVMVLGIVLAYFVVKKFSDRPMKKSPLINQGKNIYGQVHPYSAKISAKNLFGAYILTVPMLFAFLVICYETVLVMMYY